MAAERLDGGGETALLLSKGRARENIGLGHVLHMHERVAGCDTFGETRRGRAHVHAR